MAQKDKRSARETGRMYGVSRTTVLRIWKSGVIAERSQEIDIIKKSLADDFLLTVDAGRKRVMETIGDASVSQAATVAGIFYDKYRLETNQSTDNHAVYLNICNDVKV
jgi:hypothetical protein